MIGKFLKLSINKAAQRRQSPAPLDNVHERGACGASGALACYVRPCRAEAEQSCFGARQRRHNAGNQPPAQTRFMKRALQRVGCIGLLDRPRATGRNAHSLGLSRSGGSNAGHQRRAPAQRP
jgi:hypothetical protein